MNLYLTVVAYHTHELELGGNLQLFGPFATELERDGEIAHLQELYDSEFVVQIGKLKIENGKLIKQSSEILPTDEEEIEIASDIEYDEE